MRAVAWSKNKETYVGVLLLQSQRPLVFRLLAFYSLPPYHIPVVELWFEKQIYNA